MTDSNLHPVFQDILDNHIHSVSDSLRYSGCYMCGKPIEQPEEQYDMYGEMVCQDCWDYNMYQALQDGGGM